MLIRLIISPADEHRSGANQMRQYLSLREHFRRGNAIQIAALHLAAGPAARELRERLPARRRPHLEEQGWTDALRALHPNEPIYTFWKYFRNAFGRDAGLRIDHLLLSPPLAKRLTAAGVDRDVRGREHASDRSGGAS
jgi:exonuclease III